MLWISQFKFKFEMLKPKVMQQCSMEQTLESALEWDWSEFSHKRNWVENKNQLYNFTSPKNNNSWKTFFFNKIWSFLYTFSSEIWSCEDLLSTCWACEDFLICAHYDGNKTNTRWRSHSKKEKKVIPCLSGRSKSFGLTSPEKNSHNDIYIKAQGLLCMFLICFEHGKQTFHTASTI